MKNTRRALGLGLALVIILLTVVAYLPALRGGFVFDDYLLISGNPMVKASDGLYRFWLTTEAQDYYPLTWSLWWLEWRLWGEHPLGYHLVNVLLHAVNAVLVWMVLRRLRIAGAWLVGLVFAVHPVNVATVAWISEQRNTLSMLLYLMAAFFYLKFDEDDRWRWPRSEWGWYSLSLAAFLLALLSKSGVVMLPVVLLGCVWWLCGRVRWKDFLASVPFLLLSLVLALVTIWFQYYRAMKGHVDRTTGFASHLATAGWVPWFYLYKALLPVDLMVIYPKWEIDASLWISYVPGVILMGCLALFWWKRQTWGRSLFFGLGYFVVTLFPVLGFFDQGFYRVSLVADHWQYYSIVGAIALAVAAGEEVCRRSEGGRYWGTAVGVAVLLALAMGTWRRGSVYGDEETLWRDNVAKNPNAWAAYSHLGFALAGQGRLTEAIEQYEKVLWLNPDDADGHNNLGVALARAGRIQEAIGHYEQALRIEPDMAEAHNDLAIALEQTGKVQEAAGHYLRALQIKPDFAEAHDNLGNVLLQEGKIEEAMGHWEQALRIKPDYAPAHYDLAVTLQQVGRIQEAIGHYEQALRVKPDYAEAHNNLGVALLAEGKSAEAIGHFEQALRIAPDYAEAHYNLGLALEHRGQVSEAKEQYERVLKLQPDYARAQKSLARLRERGSSGQR